MVGVAPWTVYAWERQPRSPTARHLATIAEALDVDLEWLAPLPPAANLRELRQRAGFSQRQVAKQLGRGATSVAEVERARWWPSDAEQWAECYGVSIEEFRTAWEHSRPN